MNKPKQECDSCRKPAKQKFNGYWCCDYHLEQAIRQDEFQDARIAGENPGDIFNSDFVDMGLF